MKRFFPRLLGIAGAAAWLAAPDTFAMGTASAPSVKHHKSTHAQKLKRHTKRHSAKSPKAKHRVRKAKGNQHAPPA